MVKIAAAANRLRRQCPGGSPYVGGYVFFLSSRFAWLLWAQQSPPAADGARQIDPITRFHMMAALALVLILTGLAIIAIRVTGRLVKWYGRDSRSHRPFQRGTPDWDDWAQKPLAPPLDEFRDDRPDD